MMPPAIVVASIPTVVVAATAVMAPPMAAFDLNYRSIGASQRVRLCCGHSRRRHGWHEPKGTAGKSDYQKPLHLVPPPISSVFAMLTERRLYGPFRIVATHLLDSVSTDECFGWRAPSQESAQSDVSKKTPNTWKSRDFHEGQKPAMSS